MYAEKAPPEDGISLPIVHKQSQELNRAVNEIFGDLDFDSPDYILREVLKQNMWDFSVAKNYNDLVRLNNLLINDDGGLRPWHDFKYEARKVVGDSTRYLKTEYNTVVAGAQMSRLWQEIQRDKHLFPYAQFDVVMDGHTSEICTPLNKVIVSVDDPMLMYYFPPNHFNCRTTIRRLRYATPTEKYNLPQIPEAFKNNPGMSGKIFTGKNRYIANTPLLISKIAYKDYRKNLIKEAKEKLRGKKIFRSELSGNIEFGSRGIQDAINNPMREEMYRLKNEIVKELSTILETAPYLGFSTYKQKGVVKGSHIFKVSVGDKILYAVIREYSDGVFKFYSLSNKPNILK